MPHHSEIVRDRGGEYGHSLLAKRLDNDSRKQVAPSLNLISDVRVALNQWHVVTLTYDGQISTVYLDGEKIHSKTWEQAWLPHPSDPYLCVFNGAGASPFNGYIDDLTLWNRSMSQGEIRALSFLDRGLNGIVVPRGLFMQSQFFASMNSSTGSVVHLGNPLPGSTTTGNDNSRELNSTLCSY
jgi:hypothetical protein